MLKIRYAVAKLFRLDFPCDCDYVVGVNGGHQDGCSRIRFYRWRDEFLQLIESHKAAERNFKDAEEEIEAAHALFRQAEDELAKARGSAVVRPIKPPDNRSCKAGDEK